MSTPKEAGTELSNDALGPLRRMDGDPVFDEAWQAQALAIANRLIESGQFTGKEWAEALGAELRAQATAGVTDSSNSYYQAVLAALERLLDKNESVPATEMTERRDAWAEAYLSTPHGQPVRLSRD